MKKALFTVAAAVSLALSSSLAEPATIMDKEGIRSAITIFRQDPLSARGRTAGEVVRRFAENSDTVVVKVDIKVAPFLNNVQLKPEDRALFLDAVVVGSIDSQLLRNEKKDDPYGGVIELLHVYAQYQKAVPGFNLPEIDSLVEKEKNGELKKYIESP